MQKKPVKLISVDFQKEFTSPQGKWFNTGESIDFVKSKLVPFFRSNEMKVHEIVSDYRSPMPWESAVGCQPGQLGFESEIPEDIKFDDPWIKSMQSPAWVRKNIGEEATDTELPYQAPKLFTEWIEQNIGRPEDIRFIVLFGLTLDCCVLCTAQEIAWRGYSVKILTEAVDTVGGDNSYKSRMLDKSPLQWWADSISWLELKEELEGKHIPQE